MRCEKPGKICESLWFLGRAESCVYLLEGQDESIIISGGMSYIAPAIVRQIDEFGLDESKIRNALILHAHFDHIGIVPFLRERYPAIKVYVSSRGAEILSEPRSIATINKFSHSVAMHMGMEQELSSGHRDWHTGLKMEVVSDEDVIELGDMDVRIIETPGHSSCSVSAYVTQIQALFPSDGGGIPWKDKIVPAPNSNFTQYAESLKKLQSLHVKYICADHFGYIYGEEAESYLNNSLQTAYDEYQKMEKVYAETGDVNLAAKKVASLFIADNPDYLLTQEIYEGVCRQMMKQIARAQSA